MAIVLGVDPGLRKTGWGVIETNGSHLRYLGCGTIYSDAKLVMPKRLVELHEGLCAVLADYRPAYGAMEQTFVNTNAHTSLKLGHARGVLMLTAQLAGVELDEYAPNVIKKSVVGSGHADKQQMMAMVKCLLPKATITSEDAADALAVAICHAHCIHSKAYA